MGTLFFLLTSSKCDLGDFEKAMFQVFPCHFELIYGLLSIQKCDFVEVKELFQGAEWQLKPIFRLWTSTKYDFGEFNKALF